MSGGTKRKKVFGRCGEPAEEQLTRAYALLESVTPLAVDCGNICGRACCRGDGHTGMGLFPYEEQLLKGEPDFSILSTEDNEGYGLCVCQGMCRRSVRPLACRMFPYFPLVYENKRTGAWGIRVIPDPRGSSVCPLIRQKVPPQPLFERRLRRAARHMLREPKLREYLLQTSRFLMDIEAIRRKLEQN